MVAGAEIIQCMQGHQSLAPPGAQVQLQLFETDPTIPLFMSMWRALLARAAFAQPWPAMDKVSLSVMLCYVVLCCVVLCCVVLCCVVLCCVVLHRS
jgi:hypothetical protein